MNKNNKGFSLVELIVVIVILATLVGVTLGGIYTYVNKARKNTDIQNCEQLKTSILANSASLSDYGIKGVGTPYVWVAITKQGNDTDELYENPFYCSYVYLYGRTNADMINLTEITGSNSGLIKGSTKVTFQEFFKNCFVLPERREEHGATRLPVRSQTNNSFFIVMYIDENGNLSKLVTGLAKPEIKNNYRGLIYYYNTFYRDSNFKDNFTNRILYDGIEKISF